MVAVADHQPVTILIDQMRVGVDVGGDLGPQRRGQHLPSAVADQIVQQRPADRRRGVLVGLGLVVDYLEHGRTFPNQRANAGPDQNLMTSRSSSGRCATFVSPRRGPSTGSDHCSRTGGRPAVAIWTASQTARFLHTIAGHRLYAAYHLIALRGLRRGEAAGLRWCDLDLDRRVAFIHSQAQRLSGTLTACPTKTEAGRRTIALDATTVAVLRHHRSRQQAELADLGADSCGFVFTNQRGRPISPDTLTRTFNGLTAAGDLPPVRLHDLRHGAGSLALQAGANLKVIQDQLGHSSIVFTADTYVTVMPEVAHASAEAVAALILEAGRRAPGQRRSRRRASPVKAVVRRLRRRNCGPTLAPPRPHQ
jgi:integrase